MFVDAKSMLETSSVRSDMSQHSAPTELRSSFSIDLQTFRPYGTASPDSFCEALAAINIELARSSAA